MTKRKACTRGFKSEALRLLDSGEKKSARLYQLLRDGVGSLYGSIIMAGIKDDL